MRLYKQSNSPFYYVEINGKRISTKCETKVDALRFAAKFTKSHPEAVRVSATVK
jgi:hypothetical protein